MSSAFAQWQATLKRACLRALRHGWVFRFRIRPESDGFCRILVAWKVVERRQTKIDLQENGYYDCSNEQSFVSSLLPSIIDKNPALPRVSISGTVPSKAAGWLKPRAAPAQVAYCPFDIVSSCFSYSLWDLAWSDLKSWCDFYWGALNHILCSILCSILCLTKDYMYLGR